MPSPFAVIEYNKALKLGLKEKKDLSDAGKDPYPAVLDAVLPDSYLCSIQDLPIQEIPIDRIIGIKSAGRINAFSASFYPLLAEDSEFASKWINLCDAHLSDTGIRDPINCYEYLGDFYVQEGNKRVSVMHHFGAANISAAVRRILPAPSDEPRIRAYQEFLEFYRLSGLYDIQYTKPGDYPRLLAFLGVKSDQHWTEDERRTFASRYHRFENVFRSLEGAKKPLRPEEALLLWLKIYKYDQISSMSTKELKASLSALWDDAVAETGQEPLQLRTETEKKEQNVLEKLISPAPAYLNIAFLFQQDCNNSSWTKAHDLGSREMESSLADQVFVRRYYHADSPAQMETLLDEAVNDGADLVITTTPLMVRPTLKAAVKYPKIRFLNCSIDTALSSVRSYYGRIYEGKFITGLIAGALTENDRIGYVGSYPILGVPAAINAFALGARMTNPRAQICLEWSCTCGSAEETLLARGIRIISNRDIPLQNPFYLMRGEYGTYMLDGDGLTPLASPVWRWGTAYKNMVRSVLNGNWNKKGSPEVINYWLGMDSDVIDVEITDLVPEGVAFLARYLIDEIKEGRLDPFRRRIFSQSGELKNDGSGSFSPMELLHMDWLCENVEGHIPAFEELIPASRALVRELGIFRDTIPPEEETT